MKVQTGVDIIEVQRIQEAIEKQGERFLKKIYTEYEIAYCNNTGKMKYQHYAARFAGKEAVFKAISSQISLNEQDIFRKIEIKNREDGKPLVNIENLKLKEETINIDISLSHIKEYAIATCNILFK